jgi:hypothetical protein
MKKQTMKKWIITLVSMSVILSAGYFLIPKTNKPHRVSSHKPAMSDAKSLEDATQAELSTIRGELSTLKAQLQHLQLQHEIVKNQRNKSTEDKLNDSSTNKISEGAPPSDDEKISQKNRHNVFDQQNLEEVFDQQATSNDTFNEDSIIKVEDAVNQWDQEGTEVVNIECYSEICRLEMFHNDAETAHLFNRNFPLRVMKDFTSIMVVHPDGSENQEPTIMYLARGELNEWGNEQGNRGTP